MKTRLLTIGLLLGLIVVTLDIPQRAYNVISGYGWCYRTDGSPVNTPLWDKEEQQYVQ